MWMWGKRGFVQQMILYFLFLYNQNDSSPRLPLSQEHTAAPKLSSDNITISIFLSPRCCTVRWVVVKRWALYFRCSYFLSFVEYCTWIAPGVRCGRAAWISSHEQPSTSLILSIVASSSGVHRTRFIRGRTAAECTLECAPAS